MDKPVIFLAFANDQDEYLPMLNRERKNIYRSLRWFNDNNVIKVEKEATTSLEDIFEVFTQYDNQVSIFHYGGHANSSQLQLETSEDNETAYVTGLAQLLGRQNNLKLVFLNGCATRPQVDLLLKAGVKAVVATSSRVQDKMATEFAELFYNSLAGHSTIERAFHIARAFISSRYNDAESIEILRGLVMRKEQKGGQFPWGLYLNEGAEEVLQWTLPFPETSYQASNTRNLLNRVPSSSTAFVGYEKELEEFGKAILQFPLIAIEGLGGVGKTEFSIEAIKRFVPDRNRIIWVSPITRFDVMVQQSGYEEILLMDNPDEMLKFKSLEGLLDRDHRVVFIEDFHDNADDTYLRFFEQLSITRARIVIITRFLIEEIEPGVVIRLDGLGSSAITHARNLRSRKAAYEDIPDEDLETICRLTEGHPLSLELGMQLLGYGESAGDVLEAISGGEYSEHKKIEELSQRLLCSVLDHANTSAKEKALLLKFSVFRDRVPLEAVQAVMEHPHIKYALSQLIEKSLIRHRDKLYDSPPMVREFCRAMVQEDEEIEVHEKAADYFMDQRSNNFDIQLEENIIYHLSESNQWEMLGANIKKNGRLFIAHGQIQLLQSIINRLNGQNMDQAVFDIFRAEMLKMKGEFKKALRAVSKALVVYRKEKDQSGIASALSVLGEIYTGLSEPEDARIAYQEALTIALEINIPPIAVDAFHGLALIHTNKGQINKAIELVERGLLLARKLDDQYGIGLLLNLRGIIHSILREHKQALEIRRKSYEIFSAINARTFMVVAANNIAVTLNSLGKHQEALNELENALAIEKEIGAKYRIGNLYNNIGKTLLRMDENKALEKFKESLEIHSSIGYEFGKAAALHAIGVCFTQMKQFHKAIQHYMASLEICTKIGYQLGILNLYKALGNTYWQMPKKEQGGALEWYIKALALSQQLKVAENQVQQQLTRLKETLGIKEFEAMSSEIVQSLPDELHASISLDNI